MHSNKQTNKEKFKKNFFLNTNLYIEINKDYNK